MSLARIPLPSIALVLTSDHIALPSRPSVIKFEFDPLQTIHPTSSGPTRVSNQTDAQIHPTGVQIDQDDNQPVVDHDQRFCFRVANDSSTNVDSDNEQLDDELDAQTVFAEKRPTTSRESVSKGWKSDIVLKRTFFALANTIRSLLQFRLKGSPMNKSAQTSTAAVDE